MCTALCSRGNLHLFGRTLDFELSYGEKVVIAPQKFAFTFCHGQKIDSHPAIVGIAVVKNGTPLYFDAVNEFGLAGAALRFPMSARYHLLNPSLSNVASFELIPFILSQCQSVTEAEELLRTVNVTNDSISDDLPASPLHWIFADKERSITVESVSEGLYIYKNRFDVLTNEPPFPYHETNITNYMHLSAKEPTNTLCPSIPLVHPSRGAGAIGLPGDFSSASRFVRTVFLQNHTVHTNTASEEINRFFHICDNISVPFGCIKTDNGQEVYTVYTSCADLQTASYYFVTYECRRIRAVHLHDVQFTQTSLLEYAMHSTPSTD